MTSVCPECLRPFKPRGHNQKYCSEKCQQRVHSKKQRAIRSKRRKDSIKPIECPQCHATFTPERRGRKYCSLKCQTEFNSKARPKSEKASSVLPTANNESLAYLLSDVIHSGNIRDELASLREAGIRETKAALTARLRAELYAPTWPKDILGRVALALFLIENPSTHVGRFLHPHEKRHVIGSKRTGFAVRSGGR